MQAPGGVDIRHPPIHEGNQIPAGQHNDPNALNMPQLSTEEQRILAECRAESYWYRSLPLGVVFGSGAMYAVKTGLLSASQKFGPWPKTILGAGIGYFVGKLSYVSACQEKFVREAPDSDISRSIRKRRGEIVPEIVPDSNQQSYQEEGLFPDGKDTANTGGDTGYSDYFASSQGDRNEEGRSRVGGTLTYDQLRAQHRQKEMEKPYMQQGALIKPSTPVDPTKSSVPPASYSPQPQPPSESIGMYPEVHSDPPEFNNARKRTNKYGDEGFE